MKNSSLNLDNLPPVAHRGLHDDYAPENSLAAIEQAKKAGYAIELDVRLAGEVFVFHDRNLLRMTGLNQDLDKTSPSEIKELRLKNAKGEETDQTIPTLRSILELVVGEVPILIELKQEGKVGLLEETISKMLEDYKGEFAVQSFNPLSMLWFRKNKPSISRGLISSTFTHEESLSFPKKAILRSHIPTVLSKPDFISYDIRDLPSLPIKFLSSILKAPVLAWTVNNEEKNKKQNGTQQLSFLKAYDLHKIEAIILLKYLIHSYSLNPHLLVIQLLPITKYLEKNSTTN